ncbi:MAG: carboxypeptidase-like regulatory domain-containing protein [Flavobacteriales bacterium]|nr:carboxypeptidase-like regulatory domain-containing protein [Flavobacteriales bacterium]
MDGKFSFDADAGEHVLLVSFVGYEAVERNVVVTAGGTVQITVEMKGQGIDLGEVGSGGDRELRTRSSFAYGTQRVHRPGTEHRCSRVEEKAGQ